MKDPYRTSAKPPKTDNVYEVDSSNRKYSVELRCKPPGVSSEDQGYCDTCGHLKGIVSWWCTNKDAKKARGTAIPTASPDVL